MTVPEYETLLLERVDDAALVVTLNRPERLNALTFGMFDEIADLCRRLEGDPSVRAVVLTGAGRGFCAGLDLDAVAELLDMSPFEFLRGQERWARASLALHQLTTPVIAAVNGPAAGAGFSLTMACDIRIAAPSAKFNAAFVRIGLTGGDLGSSWLLPRLVGLSHANEILLTGRFVLAEEAARIGLVNRVVAEEQLLPSALELAGTIAATSPFAVRATKQVVRTNLGAASLELAIELENRNQVLAGMTRDMREAYLAFRERRAPDFVAD